MLPYLSGAFLGWSLGANDSANTFGTAVSSRMVSYRLAVVLIAIFVIIGAWLQGAEGIETIRSLTTQTLSTASICSLAAALTVTLMTLLRLPVSTSQAVVGAIVGLGITQKQLNVSGLVKVVVCWLGTPIGAIIISVIVYHTLAFVIRRWRPSIFEYDPAMRAALIICGCYSAYSLGANNVANVSAVFVGENMLTIRQASLFGGISIALGALTFSKGVMLTVGKGVVKLDVFSSLCSVLALAITIHVYAVIGVPVSTSQGIIGAVLGIGFVKGLQTVKRKALIRIVAGWLATPVVACLLALVLCRWI